MGRRGPAPRPTRLTELAGNPGKRALNSQEAQPRPAAKLPQAPRWLSEEAKAQWRRIARPLYECGLLTQVDQLALALLCEAFATFMAARAEVEREGMIAISERGGSYQHPAVSIMNSSRKELLTWLREFGMTPSARSRIRVEQGEDAMDDLFSEFEMAAKRPRT